MCGRFGLTAEQESLSVAFGVPVLVRDYRPRFNIAPSDPTVVLVQARGDAPRAEVQRWGFARDPRPGSRSGALLINARSESISERAAFRGAWRARRRCLVLADGFYEWSGDRGSRGGRIPHWIQLIDRRPFGFAALYEAPSDTGAGEGRFTILTTEPNERIARIHDRMPVILPTRTEQRAWIDPEVPPETVRPLLQPIPAAEMNEYEVGRWVNDPRHEGPRCIEPAGGPDEAPTDS